MRAFAATLAAMAIASCSSQGERFSQPTPLDAFEANAAVADARRYLGEGVQIVALCGPSSGYSYFVDEKDNQFIEDGIENGVIVFALRSDGKPEVLTRDVTRQMIVASEDGGKINRIFGREDKSGLGVWVVQYPSTGVVIAHNLARKADKSLVDVWTQNKPPVGPLPARTSTFIASCEVSS